MEELKMPKPFKKLGQLLHEEQEPFLLEAYLRAKRYIKRGFSSEISLGSAHGNSSMISFSIKGNSYCSKIISDVFNKLSFIDERITKSHLSYKISRCGGTKIVRNVQEVAELYSACQTKQLSPVSVLEESTFHDASPTHQNAQHNFIMHKKDEENHKRSVSLREFLVNSPQEKKNFNQSSDLQDNAGFNFPSQNLKSKRELQQRRKLLFDCIREVLEIQKKHQNLKQLFGAEDLGKFICEKIKYWGKESGNETSVTQLLQFDYAATVQEWSGRDSYNPEIAVEISDAILEDLKDELVNNV